MKFSRKPGVQTKDTHEDKILKRLFQRYSKGAKGIDPFARNCEWCRPFTNDINPDTKAHTHLDAEEFIDAALIVERGNFQIAILDPPFSDRQSAESYGTSNLYASDSAKMQRISKKLGDCIMDGGFIIKAGYNSNKFHDAFELVEIVLATYGGCMNDTIFSVWRKTSSLERWL